MKHLKLPAHLLAFFLSMAVWWAYPSADHIESAIMVGISLYVVATNYSRREIWPTMIIIGLMSAIRIPYSYAVFDVGFFSQVAYCFGVVVFCVMTAIILMRYHCSPTLLRLVGSNIQRPYIPQVLGMVMILLWYAAATTLVLVELAVFYISPDIFADGPPFFYRNYPLTSSFFNCVINFAIWSMMLDAHYLRERLENAKRDVIDM